MVVVVVVKHLGQMDELQVLELIFIPESISFYFYPESLFLTSSLFLSHDCWPAKNNVKIKRYKTVQGAF